MVLVLVHILIHVCWTRTEHRIDSNARPWCFFIDAIKTHTCYCTVPVRYCLLCCCVSVGKEKPGKRAKITHSNYIFKQN